MFDWLFAKKILCPYCFTMFKLREAPYRCTQTLRCPPELDRVRQQRWRDAVLMGRVLPSASKGKCSRCGYDQALRICPSCHMEIPPSVAQSKNMMFAVVGSKDAGKSHFFGVLVAQLENHVGPALDLLISSVNDDTTKRFNKNYKDPLFKRGETVQGTTSAMSDIDGQKPLIFSLQFSKKSRFGTRKHINKSITLVFFDTAGEDLISEQAMNNVNRYIGMADGIILLIDPLQLPVVRNQLPQGTPLPPQQPDPSEIIGRMTTLIRTTRRLKSTQQIATPLAIALTKLDALAPLLDPQNQIQASANHETGFDLKDHQSVNQELCNQLRQWQGTRILQQVTTDYRNHAFFALSALGAQPLNQKLQGRLQPRRVEDPFLWLLHRHGLLGTSGK